MKKRILSAVLCAFTLMAMTCGSACAAKPEDALSAQPDNSACYVVLRMNNFGNFLRWAISQKKLNTFGPALGIDEDIIGLVWDTVAQNPSQSVALLLGVTGDNNISLQLAIDLPEELRPELDRLSEGKAKPKDIMALLLGKNTPVEALFSDAIEVAPGTDGMMIVDDMLFMSAKDNILLLSIMPDGIKASRAALDDDKNRLAMNRRFDTNDFMLLHLNYDELQKITKDDDDAEELAAAYEAMKKVITGPMDVELAFSDTPEKFTINGAVNALECFQKEYLEEVKSVAPVKGGNIKLFGSGKALVALGFGAMQWDWLDKLDNIKIDGVSLIKDGIKYITDEITSTFKISEKDLSALVSGGVSLTVSGKAKIEETDACIPGVTLAFTGGEGASDVVTDVTSKLAAFSSSNDKNISLEKMDNACGFNTAFQVKSEGMPFEATIGLKDTTFALSVMDRDSLDGDPVPTKAMQALLDKESKGAFFVDFGAIRDFLTDKSNGIMGLVNLFDKDIAESVANVLDVELSVPSMAFYTPTFDTFALEFEHADIDLEKGVLAKIMPFAAIFMDILKQD